VSGKKERKEGKERKKMIEKKKERKKKERKRERKKDILKSLHLLFYGPSNPRPMVEGESGHLVFPSELFSPSVYVYVYLSPCFVSSFCLISYSYLHLYFSTIKSKSLIY